MTAERLHLTDDELDEAVMGTASPDRMAHLQDCASCRAHLERFNTTMATFNQATTAWSEAKSNALSRDLKQHRTPLRISARAAWSCAAIVALAVVASLSLSLHQRSRQTAASQADLHWVKSGSAFSDENARREIASDDAMLRQIDSAINTAEPSPEELYSIGSTSNTQRVNSRRTQVKD